MTTMAEMDRRIKSLETRHDDLARSVIAQFRLVGEQIAILEEKRQPGAGEQHFHYHYGDSAPGPGPGPLYPSMPQWIPPTPITCIAGDDDFATVGINAGETT